MEPSLPRAGVFLADLRFSEGRDIAIWHNLVRAAGVEYMSRAANLPAIPFSSVGLCTGWLLFVFANAEDLQTLPTSSCIYIGDGFEETLRGVFRGMEEKGARGVSGGL